MAATVVSGDLRDLMNAVEPSVEGLAVEGVVESHSTTS